MRRGVRWLGIVARIVAVVMATLSAEGQGESGLDPAAADRALEEADALLRAGKYPEAKDLYLRVASESREPIAAGHGAWMAAFIDHHHLHELARALEGYDRFLERYPEHRKSPAARSERDKVREILSDSLVLYIAIRQVRETEEADSLESRLDQLEGAIARSPGAKLLWEAYETLGVGSIALEDWERARRAFEAARKVAPRAHLEYLEDRVRYAEREIVRDRIGLAAAVVAAALLVIPLVYAPWRNVSARRLLVALGALAVWLGVGGAAAFAAGELELDEEPEARIESREVALFMSYSLVPFATAILFGLGTAGRARRHALVLVAAVLLSSGAAFFLYCDRLGIPHFFEATHEALARDHD